MGGCVRLVRAYPLPRSPRKRRRHPSPDIPPDGPGPWTRCASDSGPGNAGSDSNTARHWRPLPSRSAAASRNGLVKHSTARRRSLGRGRSRPPRLLHALRPGSPPCGAKPGTNARGLPSPFANRGAEARRNTQIVTSPPFFKYLIAQSIRFCMHFGSNILRSIRRFPRRIPSLGRSNPDQFQTPPENISLYATFLIHAGIESA